MNCEVEFLPVGSASKGGDAIVVRTGESNRYWVTIIDGGDIESGKALVRHIRQEYGNNCIVANVVLTHADADHASGLREVLAELDVRKFWVHIPWNAAEQSKKYFANKNWTTQGLSDALRKEYDLVAELVRIAEERNIPIHEPFAGDKIGDFTVLSPPRAVYPLLLPQFDRTPDPDQEALQADQFWIGKAPNIFQKLVDSAVAKVQKWTTETWGKELLKDGGKTSASNESSLVLYGDFGPGRKVLLTGDAGPWAFYMALAYAESNQLPMQDFMFVQIPHHGSRSNVGPTILNKILGPVRAENLPTKFSAFASSPANDDKHPRKMVLNAFIRRGASICATQGSKKVFWGGFPARPNYNAADNIFFSTQVEDYD